MQQQPTPRRRTADTTDAPGRDSRSKKAFEAPALRREAELPVATAGSFDIT